MLHDLSVPYLPEAVLRSKAAAFLNRHDSAHTVPVPIEEIVEFQLELDIVPMPGILKVYEVDAWIAQDMTAIYVDDYVWRCVANRYRFSLAHEIAHAVLHAKVYHRLIFTNTAEWKAAQGDIPEREYSRLEWQANEFAGLVLVSPERLGEQFQIAKDLAANQGVTLENASDAAVRTIAGHLAKAFDVSTDVVTRRLSKDNLWTR